MLNARNGTKEMWRAFLALAIACVSIGTPLAAAQGLLTTVEKLAPGLEREVSWLESRPAYDHPIPVIIQVEESAFRADARARRLRGGSSERMLPLVNAYAARLTSRQIRWLAESGSVEYITLDMPVRPTAKPSGGGDTTIAQNLQIIGADYTNRYSGDGVTVAVFDSGVRVHPDLELRKNQTRIVASVDFTSGVAVERSTSGNNDGYGHGSHVSGIIAGNGNKSSGGIKGVASKASILDLQVVDASGYGLTSNLIKAIDWLIANQNRYPTRVANLSLGHPPVESHLQDPLCQAVERLVGAGIVTVVSSGNLGKTAQYPVIWGSITSPGNSPSVITVGPINTRGTLTHADDIATSYGSRGYTYLDQQFKPDLVAPGNKVASLLAKFSRLHTDYPDLQIDDYYIVLSGSSMAAGYVSGAVAKMLQANPDLTPRLVKAILSLTAVKLSSPHMLEQGNGMLNVATAVALAEAIDVPGRRVKWEVEPYWYLDSEQVWAGGALAAGDGIVYSQLVDCALGPYWGNGEAWPSRIVWNDSISYNDGVLWTDAVFGAGGAVWDDGLLWTDGVFWADGFFWTEGIFWMEGLFDADSGFWGDGLFWNDAVFWADGLFWADLNPTGPDGASTDGASTDGASTGGAFSPVPDPGLSHDFHGDGF